MIFLFLIPMIGMYFFNKISEKYKTIFSIAIMVIITYIGVGIGTDYFSYEYVYNRYGTILQTNFEVGFESLYLISKSLGLSFHNFAFILRSIITVVIGFWVYKSSEKPSLSLIIYYCMFFFIWSLSAFRQGLVLAVGSYFLLNKEKEMDIKKQIALILVLTFVHKSALIYLVFILLSKLRWTKKGQLIFLGSSLLTTFLPLAKILSYFEFIPGVENITRYITGTFGFFDAPSIMRLFFFLIVIFAYDYLSTEEYMKKITDMFLNGVSLYFIMKFSEISASRFTIYSFVLLILILPILIEFYKQKCEKVNMKLKVIPIISLFSVIIVLLSKDFIAYKSQVRYVGDMNAFNFMTIFNIDYSEYDNQYALYTNNSMKTTEKIKEMNQQNSNKISFSKDDEYIVVYDSNLKLYGVMNQVGDWLIEPEYTRLPILYNDVLKLGEQNLLFRTDTLIDLSGETNNQDLLNEKVNDYLVSNYEKNKFVESDTGLKFEDVIKDSTVYIASLDGVQSDHVYKIEMDGLTYHILYFSYFGFDYYIYLDENMKPFSNHLHTRAVTYEDGFLRVPIVGGTAVYNQQGDLLWIY